MSQKDADENVDEDETPMKTNLTDQSIEDNRVLYGCKITIFSLDLPGYVGVEGFANVGLNALKANTSECDHIQNDSNVSRSNFGERVFKIVPAQQYVATAALTKHLQDIQSNSNYSADDSDSAENLLTLRLRESEKLEKRLNRESIVMKERTAIIYGHTIQLLHCQSNKFVTVKPRMLAETEKDAMRIELSAEGTEDSHFVIVPKYKHTCIGDEIYADDEVFFTSSLWKVKMHLGGQLSCNNHELFEENLYELNGSPIPSSFVLHLYNSCMDDSTINGGDLIRILQLEIDGYVSTKSKFSIPDEKGITSALELDHDEVHIQSTNQEFGSIGEVLSVNGLWQIQHVDVSFGGPILLDTTCCFRHVCSGKFLAIESDSSQGQPKIVLSRSRNKNCKVIIRAATTKKKCLLSKALLDKVPVYLECKSRDVWISFQNESKFRTSNSILMIGTSCKDNFSSFELRVVEQSESQQALFLLSMLPCLRRYVEFLKKDSKSISEIAKQSVVVESVLTELIFFCLEYTDSNETEDSDLGNIIQSPQVKKALFATGTHNLGRQHLLRELNIISILVEIIKLPFEETGYGPHSIKKRMLDIENGKRMTKKDITSSNIAIFHTELICRLCYRLVFHIIKSNTENLSRCSSDINNITVFLSHLNCKFNAEEVVAEIFTSNEELLQDIPDSIVDFIIDLMQLYGKRECYTELLTSLCRYNGQGNQPKQDILCDRLFYRSKVIDFSTHQKKNEICLNLDILLNVTCTTSINQESTTSDVSHDIEIESHDSKQRYKLSEIGKMGEKWRRYFLSTVELLAAMCSSRNYVCMYTVESIYPRDHVLHVLQDKLFDYDIQTSFTHLLYNLYIDRLPHELVSLPCRVQELNKDEESGNNLSYLQTSFLSSSNDLKYLRLYKDDESFFIALKKIILCNLNECHGRLDYKKNYLNKFILAVLQLCLQVLKFGHYSTMSEIKEVLVLVVPLLDDSCEEKPKSDEVSFSISPISLSKIKKSAIFPAENIGKNKELKSSAVIESIRRPSGLRDDHEKLEIKSLYKKNKYTLVVMECKLAICHILKHILLLDMDYYLANLVNHFHSEILGGYSNIEEALNSTCVSNCVNDTALQLKKRKSDFGSDSLQSNRTKKLNVTALIPSTGGIRNVVGTITNELSSKISTIPELSTDTYKKMKNFWNEETDNADAKISLILSKTILDTINIDTNLVRAVINLLLYDHTDLVSAAIDFLGQYFNRQETLATEIFEIQLVASSDKKNHLRFIKSYCILLKMYEETSETWLFASKDKNWLQAISLLTCLVDIIAKEKSAYDESIQNFLRLLNMGTVVLKLLKSTLRARSDSINIHENIDYNMKLEYLIDYCCQFLQVYAYRHKKNQVFLLKEIDFWKKNVASLSIHSNIFIAIFEGNVELCANVESEFLQFLVDLIDKIGPTPDILSILNILAVCDNVPIKENQNVISQLMMERHRKDYVLNFYVKKHGDLIDLMNNTNDFDNLTNLLETNQLHHPFRQLLIPTNEVKPSRQKNKLPCVCTDSKNPNDEGISNTVSEIQQEIRIQNTKYEITQRIIPKKDIPQVNNFLTSEEGCRVWFEGIKEQTIIGKSDVCFRENRSDESDVQFINITDYTCSSSIYYPPLPLLYYAKLLELYSRLTTGENFVCEARLQGLLPIDSLMKALRDNATLLPIKSKLLGVLSEGWLNTEQKLPEISHNIEVMEFLDAEKEFLRQLFQTNSLFSNSLNSQMKLRSRIVYVFESLIPALTHYFSLHCDQDCMYTIQKRTSISLLKELLRLAKEINKKDESALSEENKLLLYKLSDVIKSLHKNDNLNLEMSADIILKTDKTWKDIDDVVATNFKEFLQCLTSSESFRQTMASNNKKMLQSFLEMNTRDDNMNSVQSISKNRFEYLLEHLIMHAKASEVYYGIIGSVATIEIIQLLLEVSYSSPSMPDYLDSIGATSMLLDLLCRSHPDDVTIQNNLLTLAVSMMRSGNSQAQIHLIELLSSGNYSSVFDRIEEQIIDAISTLLLQAKAFQKNIFSFDKHHGTVYLFKFIQLLCEGHKKKMQNLLRVQTKSLKSVNLVSRSVEYFEAISKVISPECVPIIKTILEAIIEMSQGPCEENQFTIVDPQECNGCSFVETVSTLLTIQNKSGEFEQDILRDLKYRCTLSLLSLVEGRSDTVIHERLTSLLPIRLLKETMTLVYNDFLTMHDGKYSEEAFYQDLVSTEGRQRENFIIRASKIFLGVAHLPAVYLDKENLSKQKQNTCAMLNIGFNIYILLQYLLKVPAIGTVLKDSIVPGEKDHEKQNSGFSYLTSFHNRNHGFSGISGFSGIGMATNHHVAQYAEAYNFFNENCASVEILRGDKIERFFFPKPPVCKFLTSETKHRIMLEINRESPTLKLQDLFRLSEEIIDEMTHRYLMSFPGDFLFSFGKDASFALAIVLNYLIMECYVSSKSPKYANVVQESSFSLQPEHDFLHAKCIGSIFGTYTSTYISILGILQVLVCGCVFFVYVVSHGPLIMLKKWKNYARKQNVEYGNLHRDVKKESISSETNKSHKPLFVFYGIPIQKRAPKDIARSLFFLFSSPLYMYYYFFFFMACAGLFGHHFCFAFHLCDVVIRFPELTLILLAVAVPYKSLLLTFLLFMVLEYYFAIFGFSYLRAHFVSDGRNDCESLWTCFFTTFDQGFKNDGGLGGFLTPVAPDSHNYWGLRLLYDNLFYIIIVTILMNIIFGIIIDTFADQRNRMQAKQDDMINKCFICSIDRAVFDRIMLNGFKIHIAEEHYLWNYIFLKVHLKFKDSNEHDGVEDYLWNCIQKDDLSFVPVYRSINFQQSGGSINSIK